MKHIYQTTEDVSWENGKGFIPNHAQLEHEKQMAREFSKHLQEASARQQLRQVEPLNQEINLF